MSKVTNQRFAFLLLCILFACTKSEHPDYYSQKDFEYKDFPKLDTLRGKKLKLKNLYDPRRIINLRDYLVISDEKSDPQIYIYNKKKDLIINNVGLMGRGPGEIGYVWNIKHSSNDSTFWVYQIDTKKMSKFSVYQDNPFSIEEINFDNENNKMYLGANFAFSSDTSYIMNMISGKDKYIEFNRNGAEINTFDEWSHMKKEKLPDNVISSLFGGTFINDKTRNYFILASHDLDAFEIFNKKDKEIIALRGPIQYNPKFIIDYSAGFPMLAITEKHYKYMYLDVSCGEKLFYVLFSGSESFGCDDIFVFDYKGNCKK